MRIHRQEKEGVGGERTSVMCEVDVDKLRKQLRETIFRGRNIPSVSQRVGVNTDRNFDNVCVEVKASPCTTPLEVTFRDFCASNQDITWYVSENMMRILGTPGSSTAITNC